MLIRRTISLNRLQSSGGGTGRPDSGRGMVYGQRYGIVNVGPPLVS
jgi:hypothetical protein